MSITSAGTHAAAERAANTRGASTSGSSAFIANLSKEMPTDKLVVVGMHIPLRTYLDPKDPVVSTVNTRRAPRSCCRGRPNTVSLSGHTHTTEHHYFGAEDGFAGPARIIIT